MNKEVAGYFISAELKDMDISAIHAQISRTYWAAGIPLDVFQRALHNSLCFGVFTEENHQVGFARLVTDYATFAYLADVYISETHQGKGLSKWLMSNIMAHPQLRGLRRMLLATRDAHGLYAQYHFTALAQPQTFMEIWQPNVYHKTKE